MRTFLACLLLAALLAGCTKEASYRLAVANAGATPATLAVEVFGRTTEGAIAGHMFESVPANETSSVPVSLVRNRDYTLEGRTLDLSERVTTEFHTRSGTWWLTIFVEPDGRLTAEVLREP